MARSTTTHSSPTFGGPSVTRRWMGPVGTRRCCVRDVISAVVACAGVYAWFTLHGDDEEVFGDPVGVESAVSEQGV